MLELYSPNQFIEKTKEVKDIICFGAGKRMLSFVEEYKDKINMDKIACIVDNDSSKQSTEMTICDRKVKIVSPQNINTFNAKTCLILITCAKYPEILDDFSKDEELSNYTYCSLGLFWRGEREEIAMSRKIPDNIKLTSEPLIPKVIHYCWFGKNPLPDKYKYWMESWHKFCPDYEIKEWNELNYDISKNRYMLQAYENKKWGFVPDYARLDIIYQNGGIYLDTDVELVANLDELLYQKGFAGFESSEYVALGLGFGAIKGLEIIKAMRDEYDKMEFVNADGSLNLIASPGIQTHFLKQRGLVQNGDYQIVEDLTIYPEKVLCGKSIVTRRVNILPYTKSIHHYDGSWLEEDVKKRRDKSEERLQGKKVSS